MNLNLQESLLHQWNFGATPPRHQSRPLFLVGKSKPPSGLPAMHKDCFQQMSKKSIQKKNTNCQQILNLKIDLNSTKTIYYNTASVLFWIRSSAMLQICQTWTKMNKVLWDFDDKHLLNTREKKGCSCSTESTQAHAKEFSSSFLAFAIAASVSELANSHKQRAKFDSLSVLHSPWEQSSRGENTTNPQHSDTKSQLHDKRFTSCRFGVQCKKCNGSLFVAIAFLESSSFQGFPTLRTKICCVNFEAAVGLLSSHTYCETKRS